MSVDKKDDKLGGVMPPRRLRRSRMGMTPKEILNKSGTYKPAAGHLEELPPKGDRERFSYGGKEVSIDTALLRDVLDKALQKHASGMLEGGFGKKEQQVDGWLAPRIHQVIRIPRRLAADRQFWAWLTLCYGERYLRFRWQENEGVEITRFRIFGDFHRNALARLWWAAELLRDGKNYDLAASEIEKVARVQYAMELKYSWFRVAAIAFVKTCQKHNLKDEIARALSVRVNQYIPLQPPEAVGHALDEEKFDGAWWTAKAERKKVLSNDTQEGPDDGHADSDAVERLVGWWEEVLREVEADIAARGIEEEQNNVVEEEVPSTAPDASLIEDTDKSSKAEARSS